MTMPELVAFKRSSVIPTAFHVANPDYIGYIWDGNEMHWTEVFKNKDEAENELRCFEKRISYELIKTMEEQGFYPERAMILENQYQKGNCTTGVYNEMNG
jgi:hypothetical protein